MPASPTMNSVPAGSPRTVRPKAWAINAHSRSRPTISLATPACRSTTRSGRPTAMGWSLPLTLIGSRVSNSTRAAAPSWMPVSQRMRCPAGLRAAASISRAAVFIASPITAYSRRTSAPTTPQKQRPVVTPIAPAWPAAAIASCSASAARAPRVLSSS